MEPPVFPFLEHLRRKDDEHLKLLAVFHFVFGGLAILGIGFLVLHYLILNHVMMNPETWKAPGAHPPPRQFFQAFVWFYVIMGTAFLLGGIANILSGIFLRRKRHRTFSLVVAGIDCIQIPFGTVLGIFTIMVLSRESVRQSYANSDP
ncbi:MAG: hypothetical protein V4584_16955 [Verrucomicrobiota bacterium]